MQNKLYSLLLLLFFSVVPVLAQTDVVDDEDNDTTLVADSAWVDSLIHRNDTLAWPKNVQAEIEQLLRSEMFKTSQVGIQPYSSTTRDS